jgi:hypothetical protein
MMQLILIILTKRKEMIRYFESFGYGGKCALNKHFYHSNGVTVPAKKRIKHPYHGLFTNISI